MDYNALSTIPQIADELRVKGSIKNEPVVLTPHNSYAENPDNTDYYNSWRAQAIQGVYDSIQNRNHSHKMQLQSKPYLKRGTNIGPAPFQTSDPAKTQNFDSLMVGGGNITQSARYTNEEYEAVRMKILNSRASEFDAQQGQMPSRPIRTVETEFSKQKFTDDLLLRSLEERIQGGIIDNLTFSDMQKVISFYAENIYKFDDDDYLNSLIDRLNELIGGLQSFREEDKIKTEKDRGFVNALFNSIGLLIEFVEANLPFVGSSEDVRIRGQNATRKILTKSQDIIEFPSEPISDNTVDAINLLLQENNLPNPFVRELKKKQLLEIVNFFNLEIPSGVITKGDLYDFLLNELVNNA
jgi:hypothetical protein